MMQAKLKPKKCKACREVFTPSKPMQTACGWQCAQALATATREKSEKQAKLVDRRETRAKIDKIKTIPTLIKEAQRAFNTFIRARDAHLPCISCNALPPDLSGLHAGRDAGHYRSVGSASHLRFHEDNCHAQCCHCNQWGAGRAVDYRLGLIPRIGLDRVEALESSNAARKWSSDELREIKTTYAAKARALKKEIQ